MDEEYDTSLRLATIGIYRAVPDWRYESASRGFAARCRVRSLRDRSSDLGRGVTERRLCSVVDRTDHSFVGLISGRTWDGRRLVHAKSVRCMKR
jgi:hypothetical protein